MRVLPILFNADMVRAILGERKMVTRRVIKGLPKDAEFQGWLLDSTCTEDENDIGKMGFKTEITTEKAGCIFVKPLYQPGDILYVRETWCDIWNSDGWWCNYGYKADGEPDTDYWGIYKGGTPFKLFKWHPSIHMPKAAARIWLKVTDVRVERLQNITDEQAIGEGFEGSQCECGGVAYACTDCYNTGWIEPPYIGFMYTWNSTIKKSDLALYGWDANPWVWVIEFERCEKPDPCIIAGIEPAESKCPCIGYSRSIIYDEPCEMCKGCAKRDGFKEENNG